MRTVSSQELVRAIRARDRACDSHLRDPNVSLIDVGWRIKERRGRALEDELTVRVHLKRKLRGEEFEAFASRYPERVVSPSDCGHAVDIVEARYRQSFHRGFVEAPRTAAVFDPLIGGISISNYWSYSYGTLGGLVIDRDRPSGPPLLLSNWHVLSGQAFRVLGDPIVQPAYSDGGRAPHIVGHYLRDAMALGIDAAVAEVNGTRAFDNLQLDGPAVDGLADPRLGAIVTKSGRTSGVSRGMVSGIGGRTTMLYRGFVKEVHSVVHIASTGQAGGALQQVSAPGDSGSWWLDGNRAAALHFAGSDVPEYGLGFSMPVVFDELRLDLLP